jgi:hypothetical protein
MIDERMSIVAITRSFGYYGWIPPLHVSIDGRPVGKIWGNRTKEFPVSSGEHFVTVMTSRPLVASLPIRSQDCDRVELICTTDAVQLHPLQFHSFWLMMIFLFVLNPLGVFIPPSRAFMDKLVVVMYIVLGTGWIGTAIYFWRAIKARTRRPAIYLTSAFDLDEGGGERCN